MQLIVTPLPQPTATLAEPDDLKRLNVVAPTTLATEALAEAVAPWGRFDGEHAWLRIEHLREAAIDAGADGAAFDGMIDYARGAGWVDDHHVRAHVERTDG